LYEQAVVEVGGSTTTIGTVPTVFSGQSVDLTRFDGHLTRPKLRAEVFNGSTTEAQRI
jgi:hypothetical protein